MKNFEQIVDFYNHRFAFFKDKRIAIEASPLLRCIVVIPCYNEDLEETLTSLSQCDCSDIEESIEVLLVFNYAEKTDAEIKEKHQKQWDTYKSYKLENGINVRALAAFEMKQKHSGVGLARKIGMDEALKRFAEINHDGLIVCLDADCSVSSNYLKSLLKAESQGWNGLSLYYEHPYENVENGVHRNYIIDYEIFLRYYALGLQYAAYPYAFQTVGSSMAARASIYASIGGMNRRKAGEDFYFLHKVFPQGNFREWVDCTVYPSARFSERVPFGTGRAMLASQNGDKDYSRLYHPKVFMILKEWLSQIDQIYKNETKVRPKEIISFINAEGLRDELLNLQKRSSSSAQFKRNFFFWFDGFKVMKYIHFFQEHYGNEILNIEACQLLFKTKAIINEDLLLELRSTEKAKPYIYKK